MKFSLKTKISTPLMAETQAFYARLFDMHVVEEWDHDDDRGVILAFRDGKEEAFLEIYYSEKTYDLSGLSLQFKTDDVQAFADSLPDGIQRRGPVPRPWGASYLYLEDPNGVMVIVYQGCF